MKELSDQIYQFIYQGISLRTMGLLVGCVVLLLHLWALLKPAATTEFLKKLPRNQSVGTWVLTLAFILGVIVATSMDLGDFARLRYVAQIALPLMFLSLLFYCNDYLGARSIGILLLLVACPILNAAFLQPPATRVVLSGLTYAWILLALFWVGMPFTMRDQIAWITKSPARQKLVTFAGVVYGVVLLVCAVAFWGV
jgi:hypothetical protein